MKNKCIKIENGDELEVFRSSLEAFAASTLLSYTSEYKPGESVSSGYMLYDEEGKAWFLSKTPEKIILSLAEGIVEVIRIYNEIPLELRMNFLSVDKQTALCSFHSPFKVGDEVFHEGADEDEGFAIIESFELDEESNEIKAMTTKGWAHLDFLYHTEY